MLPGNFTAFVAGVTPMEDNRKKALAAALGQIEKQFGTGSVMRLGDAPETYDI